MEFRDLKQQYEMHKEAIDSAVKSVLTGTNFILGQPVKELEEKLADYVGVKYCITCGNGTDALQLALMTWKIGAGDAVFVPDFTFFASGEVVSSVGATPIFVDIDSATFNMDTVSLERAIRYVLENTDLRPRVVIAVDLFGQPADYIKIRKITKKYGLLLLEDGAQGFGGSLKGKKACSFGDISTTSFFPAKPLGCYGDGGAIFTDNEEWAELLTSYRVHGKGSDKYDNVRIGMNSRLDTIQAAILLEKMQFFDEELLRCNELAKYYSELLADNVKTPVVYVGMNSSWAQYTIQLEGMEQRNSLMSRLKESAIPSAIYYKKPMHMQRAFNNDKNIILEYHVTESVCKKCLSLPMHPYLSANEIEKIADIVKRETRTG